MRQDGAAARLKLPQLSTHVCRRCSHPWHRSLCFQREKLRASMFVVDAMSLVPVWFRRATILLAACQLSTLAVTAPAHACQCGALPSPAEALKDADVVFEGTAVERWPILIEIDDHRIPTQRYTFRVLRVWKGGSKKTIALADTGGNCSYSFADGKTYLVFATKFRYPYHSSTICVPTKPIQDAEGDLAVLGPGAVVQPSFVANSESAAHRLSRRGAAAALIGISWMRYVPRTFFESELGVWLAFILTLAFSAVGYIGLRSLVRRRWRWRVVALVLATMLTLSAAALLGCGYWYAATHRGFRHLIE